MMNIYDIRGNVILSVPVLPESEHAEELMRTDEVRLYWNSDNNATIPDGAYVIINPSTHAFTYADGKPLTSGEKYSLVEPYSPAQKTENQWRYEPIFVSQFYALYKTPFYFYTYEGGNVNGKIISRESEWTLTDTPYNFMDVLCRAIYNETGIRYSFSVDASLASSATVNFRSADIISGLNQIANAFDTEFWLEKSKNTIHLSRANDGASPKVLTVGTNVNVPSVTEGGDGYYNRFVIFGSSRNITQDYQSAVSSSVATRRLTLDPSKYPDSCIDLSNGGMAFTKILTFDEIYPSATDLTVTNLLTRPKYRLDKETNDKIPIDDDGHYDQYFVYYFKILAGGKPFVFNDSTYNKEDNPNGMLLPGLNLSVHFSSGQLRGREFELIYHKEAKNNDYDEADITPFNIPADCFEIKWITEGDFIIPSIETLHPADGDRIVLFNIMMPSEYVSDAQTRLEDEAFKTIGDKYIDVSTGERVDMNSYQLASNPVAFTKSNPGLRIGSAVRYVNTGYSHDTRVTALVTKLDFPVKQTITIGNGRIVGTITELKEQAANANQNIDILAALNESTKSITEAFERTYTQLAKSMDKYFELDSVLPTRVNLKPAYTHFGARKGLFFDAQDSVDGNAPDLYVRNITVNGNTQKVLYTTLPIASESWISALGINPAEGGSGDGSIVGGTSYDRLDTWPEYDSTKDGWVLSAGLGYELHTRLTKVEGDLTDITKRVTLLEEGGGGTLSDFTITGVGNALTSVEKSEDGKSLVFRKDTTFVTIDTVQTVTGFKTFKEKIKIGEATLEWDPDKEALKSDKPIYSLGWISALGANDASGGNNSGSGASYLYDLLDVNKNSVQNAGAGQYLMYDGSKWVARTVQISDVSGFVKKSGDMMTGPLNSSSSILNSGFNADLLDGKHASDFIGVNDAVASAAKLKTARKLWGQPFDGTDDVTGSLTSVTDITMSGKLKIGGATFTWVPASGSNPGYLKLDTGFASDSFVSALGVNPNSGDLSLASYLNDLLDVDTTGKSNGKVLTYRNGKWVAETPQSGLDTASLASYLSSNGYVTQSWVTGQLSNLDYVKKSGDTMSGALTANAGIILPATSRQWVAMVTDDNVIRIKSAAATDASSTHPVMRIDTASGNALVFGKYNNQVGFYGWYAGSIGSSTYDFRTYWATGSGLLTHSADMTVLGTLTVGSTTSGTLKVGGATFTWDNSKKALIIDSGFASESFISALGVNPDTSGSTAATYLYDLLDVNKSVVSKPSAGQVLTYRNGKWTAETIQTGLDTSQLSSYLSSNNYVNKVTQSGSGNVVTAVTQSGQNITVTKGITAVTSSDLSGYVKKADADNAYVAKSGDTMSGALTANAGIILPAASQTWANMVTYDNVIRIKSGAASDASNAHPVMRIDTSSGNALVFGKYADQVGFYGWFASSIGSSTYDFRTYWATGSGTLTHSAAMTVTGAMTLSSTLSVASAATFNSTVKIGGATLTWDNTNKALKIDTGFYSEKFLSALGASSFSGETVGSASLPIYLKAGTPTACTASSLFSALSVSGTTLTVTIAGQTRTATLPSGGSSTSGNYLPLSGGTLTGQLTVEKDLTLASSDGTATHLKMERGGYNYIQASASGGSINFLTDGASSSAVANSTLQLVGKNGRPGTTNTGTWGEASYRWANIYATTINVTSTTVVSNLNADMLDGYEANTLFSALSVSGTTLSATIGGKTLTATLPSGGNVDLSGYVALSGAQTISGTKTFSAQQKFTYSGSPFTVSSTTLVSNLNADMIDGYEASGLFTALSYSGSTLTVTIGGTKKTCTISAGSSTSGDYLPISGGTLTGALTANAGIILPATSRAWKAMVTDDNVIRIKSAAASDASNAHPVMRIDTASGNALVFGKYNDQVGFYGWYAGSIGSSTYDFRTYWATGSGKITHTASITATSFDTSSDSRLKNVLCSVKLSVEQIANAPAVEFVWKKNGERSYGTIAQYWRSVNPVFVNEIDGDEDEKFMSIQYGNLALVSVVSVAREFIPVKRTVSDHERRIAALEKENEEKDIVISELRKEVELLKSAA